MNLTGKRILLTQSTITAITGSVVLTYELATYLQSAGAQVAVYTYAAGGPVKKLFADAGIPIYQPSASFARTQANVAIATEPLISLADFDLVWVNHQTLPPEFIAELADPHERREQLPRFVFMHMSARADNPLELPYLYDLEQQLSSRSLFNSIENQQIFNEAGYLDGTRVPTALYENPVPLGYVELNPQNKVNAQRPARVAIVSNHTPEELLEAAEILRAQGYDVVLRGDGQPNGAVSLITPEFIASCNAVVSIGKTVQYCLVAGVPIYVYDHFGGPGFLTQENYERAKLHNFSGRGFGTKSATEIANEIAAAIPPNRPQQENDAAHSWQVANRRSLSDYYRIDNAFAKVLDALPPAQLQPWSSEYATYLQAAHTLAVLYLRNSGFADDTIAELRSELGIWQREVDNWKNEIKPFQESVADYKKALASREAELAQLRNYVEHVGNAEHGILHPGDRIAGNSALVSENGQFRLEFSNDGELQLRAPSGAKYASGTTGDNMRLEFQADGNLVLYHGDEPIAFTNTEPFGNYLVLKNDGNLVIFDSQFVPVWALTGVPNSREFLRPA